MNDLEKLRVMLPHWINHNQGHGKEFAQWAEKLAGDSPDVAQLLRNAVCSLQEAQSCLEEALEKTGGIPEVPNCSHQPHTHGQHGHSHSDGDGHHHHHS